MLIFFLAGATSLMFEIIWQRIMILALGASALATTAILTAFFGGIAFGSWLGGEWLKRVNNAILFFAGAVLLVGIWGMAVKVVLDFMSLILFNVFQSAAPGGGLFFIVRFVMAVVVVFPATSAIGAMIPAMNQILARYRLSVGEGVSLAYGLNTVGSVFGCLMAGFVFIPGLGIQKSTWLTGGVNICIALFLVIMCSKKLFVGPVISPGLSSWHFSQSDFRSKIFMSVYFLSGFLALGYEIVWLRILGIVASNSIITLTVALSVYLLGFSCGSLFLYPRLAPRFKAQQLFLLSNWGVGVLTLCLIPVYYQLGNLDVGVLFALIPFKLNVTGGLLVLEAVYSFIVMFVPTIFMGMAYPTVCDSVIKNKEQTAQISGYIYSVGSFGSALGVFVVSLFCVPLLGLAATLTYLCISNLLLGLVLLAFDDNAHIGGKTFFRWASLLFILFGLILGIKGYPFLDEGQVYAHGNQWIFKTQQPGTKLSLLRYKSGYTGTVSVIEAQGLFQETVRSLEVDGEPVAGTFIWAKMDAKLLAHIPLLLHPNPHNAITVGFGSGGTSWSMTRYGIEVECVEIEPEVVRSAHLFAGQNHDVLNEPNLTMVINDARNHFYVTDKKYDVISTDVTNLQYKHNASLYTKEYFLLLKSRLKTNGIASAWVPMGGVTNTEFKILLKTFQEVFPHTSVWFVGERQTSYYAILTGTDAVLEIDYAQLKQKMSDPLINRDLAEIHIQSPLQIVSFLFLDETGVRNYAGDVPLHTDDKSILEFYAISSLDEKVQLSEILKYRLKDFTGYVMNMSRAEQEILHEMIRSGNGLNLRSGHRRKIIRRGGRPMLHRKRRD